MVLVAKHLRVRFHARRNTFVIFLYRPSPQIPKPSPEAAQRCYDAAAFNIGIQKHQMEAKLVDVTWIFTQSLFMELNTVLWSLSYSKIRQLHPADEVRKHVNDALVAIGYAKDRWPGVQSALQLYDNLVRGCFKAYENDATQSPISNNSILQLQHQAHASPPANPGYSPASTNNASLVAASSPSSLADSYADTYSNPNSVDGPHGMAVNGSYYQKGHETAALPMQHTKAAHQGVQPVYALPEYNLGFGQTTSAAVNPSMSAWDPNVTLPPQNSPYYCQTDMEMDTRPWLGSFGDEYSRYAQQMYFPSSEQMQALSEQQQSELMATLEQDKLPDVSRLVSESATFYSAQLA